MGGRIYYICPAAAANPHLLAAAAAAPVADEVGQDALDLIVEQDEVWEMPWWRYQLFRLWYACRWCLWRRQYQ
jgi:hypothetical protein